MSKNKFFSIIIIGGALVYASFAFAQSLDNISYPVAELGNCLNKSECKKYCDDPANVNACLNFAEKNNLIPKSDIEIARKFATTNVKGPGGCSGVNECRAYCDDISHINECVSFAEKHGLLPAHELEEAKKIKSAIDKGIKPPACKSKQECDSYCSQGGNMEECITFAEAAGFLSDTELQEAKKFLQAVKKGIKPPPCAGKNSCEEYCSQEEHFNECVAFAEAAGIIPEKDLEVFKKTGGKGPGGCRGKTACDAFCNLNEANMAVCIDFAVQNGLMSSEEAEIAKRTGGKGPGGCQSKEECESFCNDPANQETCFNFSKEHGFINEEEIQNIEKDRQMTRGLFSENPEAKECIKKAVGEEVFSRLESGTYLPSRELGDKMGQCFRQFQKEDNYQDQDGNMMPPPRPDGQNQEFRGPGGCSSPEECREYCMSHPQECGQMQRPSEGTEGNYQRPPEGYQPPPGTYPTRPPESEYPHPEGSFLPMPPGDNYQPIEYQRPPEGYQPPPGDYQQPPSDYQQPEGESAPPPPPAEPVSFVNYLGALLANMLIGSY